MSPALNRTFLLTRITKKIISSYNIWLFMKINKSLLLFITTAAFLAGCSKNGSDLIAVNPVTPLNVINASGDTVNFYQNGTRLNIGSNLLPGGQYTGISVLVGTPNFQFKKAGNPNVLVSAPLTIQALTRYTMFMAGETSDRVFLIKDTLAAVADSAKIRFVNASPDAGPLDFTISTFPTVKGMPFKSATGFYKIPKGKVFYSVYRQGITTPLASGNLTLSGSIIYTLFSKGLVSGTGTNLLGTRIVVTPSN